MIHRDSSGGAAKFHNSGRSLLPSIALFLWSCLRRAWGLATWLSVYNRQPIPCRSRRRSSRELCSLQTRRYRRRQQPTQRRYSEPIAIAPASRRSVPGCVRRLLGPRALCHVTSPLPLGSNYTCRIVTNTAINLHQMS